MSSRLTYVVVADAARARMFLLAHGKLKESNALVAPKARLRDKDLDADRPASERGRHPTVPRTTSKEYEAVRFAKIVAEELTRLVEANPECRIALVAAPRFLGHLRKVLHPPIARHVHWEESKDFSKCAVEELEQRLPLQSYARQLL